MEMKMKVINYIVVILIDGVETQETFETLSEAKNYASQFDYYDMFQRIDEKDLILTVKDFMRSTTVKKNVVSVYSKKGKLFTCTRDSGYVKILENSTLMDCVILRIETKGIVTKIYV